MYFEKRHNPLSKFFKISEWHLEEHWIVARVGEVISEVGFEGSETGYVSTDELRQFCSIEIEGNYICF